MSTSDLWLSPEWYQIPAPASLKPQKTKVFFWQKHDFTHLWLITDAKRPNEGQLTFSGAGGEQFSKAASGCGGRGLGARQSYRATNRPHSSCLLLVLPSDSCDSHLLGDWEAVGRGDRGQRCLNWVGHGSRVTVRVEGNLGVCVPCVREAVSLVRRALGPHGGGSVGNDSGGHIGGCVVTKLMAGQRVEERNTCRGRLLDAAGECDRNRWIWEQLMSVWHGSRCDAGRVVFTAVLAWPGLVRLGVGWGGLG